MSITGSNNPFSCEPVVFAQANAIISLGTITRAGNTFTFSVGFVWKINGVTYQNAAPVTLTVANATTGFKRIDNALLNTSNTIELQQGIESETIAIQPTYPFNLVFLTSWNINGASILAPIPADANQTQTQIHISASTTILPSWNNAIIIITAPGVVLTVPADLPVITFEGINRPSANCNFALSGAKSWVFGTPALVTEKTFVFVVDSLNSNEIYLIK